MCQLASLVIGRCVVAVNVNHSAHRAGDRRPRLRTYRYTVTSPPSETLAIEPLCTSVTHIARQGPRDAYGPPSIATLSAALTPA